MNEISKNKLNPCIQKIILAVPVNSDLPFGLSLLHGIYRSALALPKVILLENKAHPESRSALPAGEEFADIAYVGMVQGEKRTVRFADIHFFPETFSERQMFESAQTVSKLTKAPVRIIRDNTPLAVFKKDIFIRPSTNIGRLIHCYTASQTPLDRLKDYSPNVARITAESIELRARINERLRKTYWTFPLV